LYRQRQLRVILHAAVLRSKSSPRQVKMMFKMKSLVFANRAISTYAEIAQFCFTAYIPMPNLMNTARGGTSHPDT
jgi:hypothetical protein